MRSYSKLLMMMGTLLLVVLSAIPAQAQTAAAMINGRITDPQGLVVPGAEVRAININTNIKYTTKSNDVGLYSIPNVSVGTYRVIVEKQGFVQIVKPDVQLHVQDIAELNFSLQIGSVTQTVTVEGGAPLVSVSPSVSTIVDRKFVGNLPLNGRSFQSLILLTPGVTVMTYSSNDYGQFSVNGQRASTNYFSVDGVSANIGSSITKGGGTNTAMSGADPGLSIFGGTNNLVSVDALEEFKIQTSTYSSEFGRQPGGQISLVTRSGTNQFHGTMFEYFRNDALDAYDYFTKLGNLKKPALRQNDFGGTFSGPVVIPGLYDGHDRTFFFFSYEGERLRVPSSGSADVPSMRVRALAAPAPKQVLDTYPLPIGPEYLDTSGTPTGWAPYFFSVSNPNRLDATSIRMDHTLSSKLTLFGRFNESPSSLTAYSVPNDLIRYAATRTLTLGATSALTARISNEFRFNYSRQLGQRRDIATGRGGATAIDEKLLNNGDGYGAAFLEWGGAMTPVYAGDYVKNYQRQLNFVDNFSWVRGKHQVKFGIDYRRLMPIYGAKNNQTVIFLTEDGLKTSIPDLGSIYTYDSARPRYDNLSLYSQDTWRVTPRLTLDYGLRWELNPAPSEADGKMPVVVTGVKGSDTSQAALAPKGSPFYHTFYRAFAPRTGVAYQLNQASGRETVLRGGFGVYYDLGSSGATTAYPLSASTVLISPHFPLSSADATRPTITVPTSLPVKSVVYFNNENLKLPYTLQWNVAVEQSLGTEQSLSVSYVGAAARRLLTTQVLNYVTSGTRPNPNFVSIYYTWNGPTSDYNSMQVQYKARMKRGLQGLVNYTWAHAIDQVSTDIGTFYLVRGNADFDIRHNFSAAVNYDLPNLNAGPVLKHFLSHWTLDTIVHAQSGLPVDITTGSLFVADGVAVYSRPNYVGGPLYVYDPTLPGGRKFNSAALAKPATGTSGNLGRNVFRALPIWQADVALGRNFYFSEKWKLLFKAEVFNVFNHPNFGRYTTSYTSVNLGKATATLANSLGGLSSLYQMGGPRSVQFSLKITF